LHVSIGLDFCVFV